MKLYEVMSTRQADNHVLYYAEYIQNELLNPQAARKFVNDIRIAVKSLNQMPQRNPRTEEEPWRSMGVRKMVVREFIVYYWIDEENKVVHVTGVVYGKRDQTQQLANIDFDQ